MALIFGKWSRAIQPRIIVIHSYTILILTELLYGMTRVFHHSRSVAAQCYRKGDFKLIVGEPGEPSGWIPPEKASASKPWRPENQTVWLFNVERKSPWALNKVKLCHHKWYRVIKAIRDSISEGAELDRLFLCSRSRGTTRSSCQESGESSSAYDRVTETLIDSHAIRLFVGK